MAKYRFGNVIGGGGFGVVQEATRDDDGWKCVVKLLKKDHNEEELLRFKREVRIQAQMDHPNIVPIAGMNLTDDPPWFIMPRALLNLSQYLQQSHGEGDLWIFVGAARGVEYAHKNGVIHRDLKTANILIYKDTNGGLLAEVSDFGLGRLVDRDTPTLTSSNIGMGTVEYVAPEQWRNAKSANAKADIYSLGKILYEILTGQGPYPSLDFSIVPKQFVYIIQKATDNDPLRRYESVGALLEDLDLVTRRRQDLEKPAEMALQKVKELLRDEKFDSKSLEWLARFLCENADDVQMLIRVVPHIPNPILKGLVENHLDTFKIVFKAYDSQVDGPLTFDYCDVVADFYGKTFQWTMDSEVRIIILRRLPILGYTHNRWHVGTVFARIVSTLNAPDLIMAVRDVLTENPNAADWCGNYLRDVSVPPAIRKVLK